MTTVTLHNYQKESVLKAIEILKIHPAVLLAEEMGLGKSAESITICKLFGFRRILVIAPASLLYNWQNEFKKWRVNSPIQIIENGKTVLNPHAQIFIISYNLILKKELLLQLRDLKYFDFLIMDESHKLKNEKAKTVKIILGNPKFEGVKAWARRLIFISGTPVLNRPMELWPILSKAAKWVLPGISYWQYAVKFCGAYYDSSGYFVLGEASNQPELNQILKSKFMLRHLKKDVLTELPDKTFTLIEFSHDEKTGKLLREQKEMALESYRKHKKIVLSDHMATVRRLLGISKLKLIMDFVENVMASTDKVILFAYHKDVIWYLKTHLKEFNPVVIEGGTPLQERNNAVETFQNEDGCRLFIGQIQAAGVGLNLTAASTVIICEPDWVPSVILQAVDRAHRIGQKNAVTAYLLAYKNSIDSLMIKKSLLKQKNINMILNGVNYEEIFQDD